jgi:hypothetical protein
MCESGVTLQMAAESSSKLAPPSMLASGVQIMRVVEYESTPCATLASAQPPASSLRGILKQRKPVQGSATPSLPTLSSTAQPSRACVRFSLAALIQEYSHATADFATTLTLAPIVDGSTKSLPTKRRRSEVDMLEEWDMQPEAYYNKPTLPKFQIYKPGYKTFDPFEGEHTEDNETKDPDYNPKQGR